MVLTNHPNAFPSAFRSCPKTCAPDQLGLYNGTVLFRTAGSACHIPLLASIRCLKCPWAHLHVSIQLH